MNISRFDKFFLILGSFQKFLMNLFSIHTLDFSFIWLPDGCRIVLWYTDSDRGIFLFAKKENIQ